MNVAKPYRRTPKGYTGTRLTTHQIGDVLPGVLTTIRTGYSARPDLVLAAWPEVIGPQLAPMTQAVSFTDGVLTVKVMNSTLHSLLTRQEKTRLLKRLREKFPNVAIESIYIRIG